MRKVLFLAGLLFLSNYLFAQVQGIQWKKIIGTEDYDDFYKIIPAVDGGYLIVGQSADSTFNYNVLVAKVNKVGALEWQKTFGGSGDESATAGIATPDGGFLILGLTTTIQNDGDVTGHHGLDPNVDEHFGDEELDVWILKISATGNLIWAKTFGGRRYDAAEAIIKTSDNYYMIAGTSSSGDGDLTGIRRSPATTDLDGANDIWIFKIDDNGNILWQKCFGGTDSDYAYSIITTASGYMIAGGTDSDDMDIAGPHHSPNSDSDVWLVNIDNSGNIIWEKTFGGSVRELALKIIPYNTNYLLGCITTSNDGDVVGYNPGNLQHNADMWLLEISPGGQLVWQKTIGTERSEEFGDMALDADNNLVVVGVSNNYLQSPEKYYPVIINIDPSKNVNLESYSPLLNGMQLSSVINTGKREFYIAGVVFQPLYSVAGDHLYGSSDCLFLKFGDVNTITGKAYLDNNANHIHDTGEPLLDNVRISSTKGASNSGGLTIAGIYSNSIDTGTYTTSAYFDNPNYTIFPLNTISNFTTYFNTVNADFAVTPVPNKNDLSTVLIPLTPARPGFEASYRIKVFNNGTTILNPVIKLEKDTRQSVISSTPVANTTVNNTITWQLPALTPFDTATIDIVMQVAAPPTLNIGDSLKLYLVTGPVINDETPVNNTDTVRQLVVGSFDPNDKTETHGGAVTPAQISGADPFTYIIRFQNMGTDTAFTVTVRDTLDARLDWNSLEMIDASHPYMLSIEGNNKLTWQFNNIKLPDHNINEPASHGHIVYRIKPQPTVPVGDTIKNTAGIYFDYNLPVQTNIQNTVVLSLTPLPATMISFKAVVNNSAVDVTWETATEQNVHHFEVLRSASGVDYKIIGIVTPGQTKYFFKDNSPLTGYNYYRIKIVDLDGAIDHSTIALVNIRNENNIISSIYPNPVNGRTVNIKLQGMVQGSISIQVLDQTGRNLLTKQYYPQSNGDFKTELNLGQLTRGSYILKIVAGNRSYLNTLLIQ